MDDLSVKEFSYGPSDYIRFVVDMNEFDSSGATRSESGMLAVEEGEWQLSASDAVTRGAPYTSFPSDAGIVGFNFDTWNDASTTPWAPTYNKLYNFDYQTLNAENPVAWMKAPNTYLRVYAYAPNSFIGTNATLSSSSTPGEPTITYTVPTDVTQQIDLLAAKSADKLVSEKTSVPLTFNHALSAVRFNVGFDCKVQSISLQGVYDQGIYTIGGNWASHSYSVTSPAVTNYFIGFGYNESTHEYDGLDFLAGQQLTSGSSNTTMMLIPQTIPAGAKVVLRYKTTGDADWRQLEYPITGKPSAWEKGKRYTYTVYNENISYIYFDLAAGNIEILNGTYTGYVYENNGASTYTVTGTHLPTNKYYVYQSSTITGSVGYYTGTGYEGAGGSGTVRVPVYSELTYSDQSWSKYVTNRKDVDAVINGWTSAAATAKRSSTPNTILIYCSNNSYAANMNVDITIDNLWCSYFFNHEHRVDGGFMIGPCVKEGYSIQNRNNRYERVTLRLKGDNRFNNVLYWGHPADQAESPNRAFFKVTSADGDGSTKGSITVTLPNTGTMMAGATTMFGSGDDDECNPCNDMYINGGTLYVGCTNTSLTNGGGFLGSGSNNHCDFEINGGVITAVAKNNGAAIGAGGGYSSIGGNAKLVINGGEIYAYQLGAKVSTAAIGGGSSFNQVGNRADIVINGGIIYAESIGGAAIGGGSSSLSRGGDATIRITGGSIRARSVAGRRGDGTVVEASTGIGGGTGGSSGNGGSASVTITGGNLYTGSIGGGETIGKGSGYRIGSASIDISGSAYMQGQFVMAAGSSTPPSFTMSGGIINNSSLGAAEQLHENGGAVYMEAGTFTMTGGTITDARGTDGGAVYLKDGNVSFRGGSIKDSSASHDGGAFYVEGGNLTISGGTIDHCSSGADGGAIYVAGGIVTINEDNGSSEISNNSALGSGGGVFVQNCTSFSMSQGTIIANAAIGNGGGVAVSSSSDPVTVNITGGSIKDNSSRRSGGGVSVEQSAAIDASVILGVLDQGNTNPEISGNVANISGGGIYASGTKANIDIYSGKINDNSVTVLVPNDDVANANGMVKLHSTNVNIEYVTITYHMNDGSNPETTTTQQIVTAVNSALETPSWTYKTLRGWNTNAAGTGGGGAAGDYHNGDVVNLTSGLDLYAIWVD